MLGGDQRRVEMALSLLFSLPGTPLIFWGDELGMGDDLAEPGRFGVRLPMPWSGARNGGFSTADRSKLLRRPIESGPYGYSSLNVEAALKDPASQLSFMKELIHLRRRLSWIGDGYFEAMSHDDAPVMVHRIRCESSTLIAVHNLKADRQQIGISGSDLGRAKAVLMRGLEAKPGEGGLLLDLDSYGFGLFAG